MLTVSHDEICRALGIVRGTSVARLRGLPWTPGANGTHRYPIADVLPTVKDRQRGGVPALFDLAQDDGEELWVGDNAICRARRLEGWLKGEQIERLFGVRVAYTNALAASLQSSVLFTHLEALRLKLVLTDPVLRWTVLGDAEALPPFEQWVVAYSITNSRYENLHQKEAA